MLLVAAVVVVVALRERPAMLLVDHAAPISPPGAQGEAFIVPRDLPRDAVPDADVPASLVGTRPPSVMLDAQGNLLVDLRVRDLFDYFLSAMGEESLDAISRRLAAHLQAELPPAAAERAWRLFADYLAYHDALDTLTNALSTQNDMASDKPAGLLARLDSMMALRRAHLGPEVADAFFAAEEAYDRDALLRMELDGNAALTPEEKLREHARLDAALSPEILAVRRESGGMAELSRAVEFLRLQGADEDDIQALRENALGTEAAGRLAALDREEAAWNERYKNYAIQRDAINAAALADADRQHEIDALRERIFDARERQRVAALDRIAAGRDAR